MSEYCYVGKTVSRSVRTAGLDGHRPGHGLIPSDPTNSLHGSFHVWLLSEIFMPALALFIRIQRGL
jgi:hypothetical protein